MLANLFNLTYDVNLVMKDAGLVAASAAATVSGAAKILDLSTGGLDPTAGMQLGPFTPAVLLIDVSAIEIASNDEIYDIVVQASPDAAFGTAGNIVELAAISLGAKGVKRTDSDKDDTVGRYLLPVLNWRDGLTYRYLRIYTVVGGTIATGINYSARFCPLKTVA